MNGEMIAFRRSLVGRLASVTDQYSDEREMLMDIIDEFDERFGA